MANKKNWIGILVILLVFGMTVVGCVTVGTAASDGSPQAGGRIRITNNHAMGDAFYVVIYYGNRSVTSMFIVGDSGNNYRESNIQQQRVNENGEYTVRYTFVQRDGTSFRPMDGPDSNAWAGKTINVSDGAVVDVLLP